MNNGDNVWMSMVRRIVLNPITGLVLFIIIILLLPIIFTIIFLIIDNILIPFWNIVHNKRLEFTKKIKE